MAGREFAWFLNFNGVVSAAWTKPELKQVTLSA